MGLLKTINSSDLSKKMLDETENKRIISIGIYIVLFVVSAVMTVLNVLQNKGILTYSTAIFCVLCLINLALTLIKNKTTVFIASLLFSIELIVLFTFFILSGNPEGFSAIWCCMLPSLGLFFFGRKHGSFVCLTMLVIMVFLFRTQMGLSLLWAPEVYTISFRQRFPLLYFAFFFLAWLLETLRVNTFAELSKLNNLHREISIRDQLTGLFNREGLHQILEHNEKKKVYNKIGIVIFDIDHFKAVNDTLGHSVGDVVLKEFSHFLKESFDATVCRWGGEEFAMVYYDQSVMQSDMENFRKLIENTVFDQGNTNVRITVSAGVYETTDHDRTNFNTWVNNADSALYTSKETGRNKYTYF